MQKISLLQNKIFRKFIKILIWTVAVFMLLCLLFNTYKYFEQVSFWQEKLELYEIEDVSAYDIVNTAYKGFFSKNHFIKINDGIYMDINSSFKDGFYKMITEPEKMLVDKLETMVGENYEEFIHGFWDMPEKIYHALDPVKLTDGVEGKIRMHISKMYFVPFPVSKVINSRRWPRTSVLEYHVYFVK